jgi:hypothetical protein
VWASTAYVLYARPKFAGSDGSAVSDGFTSPEVTRLCGRMHALCYTNARQEAPSISMEFFAHLVDDRTSKLAS